jgi:hypothetical protein
MIERGLLVFILDFHPPFISSFHLVRASPILTATHSIFTSLILHDGGLQYLCASGEKTLRESEY